MHVATCTVFAALVAGPAGSRVVGFDDQVPGGPPQGFTCSLTGNGRAGLWAVVRDDTAPSPPLALVQKDADTTSYRFPVCVLDEPTATDVDVSVRFKPLSGSVDQAAGLVWRFRDKDNYYLVRANALEGNVVLYKVVAGKRTDIDPKGAGLWAYGRKARVASGVWGTLRVVVKGGIFEAFVDGQKLFAAEDDTFTGPGKVGIWTKADSVTHFDDLSVVVLGDQP